MPLERAFHRCYVSRAAVLVALCDLDGPGQGKDGRATQLAAVEQYELRSVHLTVEPLPLRVGHDLGRITVQKAHLLEKTLFERFGGSVLAHE